MARALLSTLLAGTILAGCAHPAPTGGPVAPDAVGMSLLAFEPAARTVPVGTRIEFVNGGSRAVHVLVPGEDAQRRAQAGVPSFGGAYGHRSEVGDHWRTPAWTTPGTYRVTCTLHPSMNLTVTVQ